MAENIRLENVKVHQSAENWEDAIRIAGNLLVKCRSITTDYIEKMIESIHTLGPYIVLTPGFALAHATPCKAVKISDMSIVTFQEGISFHSDNDPVYVIICLACTDQESHLERLQSIGMKLMEDGMIERMHACQSEDELYHLIND